MRAKSIVRPIRCRTSLSVFWYIRTLGETSIGEVACPPIKQQTVELGHYALMLRWWGALMRNEKSFQRRLLESDELVIKDFS
jgi:hypothetical protein